MISLEEKHLKIVQDILLPYQEEVEFYCFGSRVDGSHRPFSDLDICYIGKLDKKQESQIKDSFYQSDLPIKVDFVAFEKLPDAYRDDVNEKMLRFN